MVQEQLIPRNIQDKRVLDVFSKIERHRFIPEYAREGAYGDFPISIGEGQTISQPYIVALMTECLQLQGEEKVLEIGTGSGYQTAILAELAGEVYSIERIENLAINAQNILNQLGYKNIFIKTGDGTLGWSQEAPFDRIIITAAAPRLPLPLVDQLKEGGIMAVPLGETFSQVLTIVAKKNGKLNQEQVCACVFVPLVGRHGWNNHA
jgi:protein-L-isoaspartate(D-aspartate) O-methyltransferase